MHILIPALHRPEQPTGVCRYAANLALALAERPEVTQISLLLGAWQLEYFTRSFDLTSAKIKLLPIAIKNSSVSRNRWFLTGFPQLAYQISPDIIHLSFPFPILRRQFKAPIIATIHDLYPYEYPQNFGYPQVWFNQGFLRQCVGQSDGLTCVSKMTLSALNSYFPKLQTQKPIRVIYNAVSLDSETAVKPKSLPQTLMRSFILAVAQHRKNKNLDLLINAYAALHREEQFREATHLLLVGSPGPETEHLHRLVEILQLQDYVTFASGLTDGELRWLYENARLLAMPSSTEGFCLPLVEAQSLGCPVVCSDIPIFDEIASTRCHFFSLADTPLSNLIKAMGSALAQPHPVEGYINPAFLRSTVAQQYLELYQVIARKN